MSQVETSASERAVPRRLPGRSTAGYQILSAVTLVLCAVLLAVYLKAVGSDPIPARTQLGRVYGLVGFLLLLVLAAYGARRYAYHVRLMPLEWWYRAHLLLGLLALTLLGCHSGFALRSPFLAVLQVSFWGVVLTGVLGWAYQSALKSWMVRHEYRPTILKELDGALALVRARVEREIGALETEAAAKGSISLQTLVTQLLERMRRARSQHLLRFPDHTFWESQVEGLFQKFGLGDLSQEVQLLVVELNHLEVLRWYHVVLRSWTTLHLLFTFLAVQMMLWHVWMVSWYPR
jgi:hypothetical protein